MVPLFLIFIYVFFSSNQNIQTSEEYQSNLSIKNNPQTSGNSENGNSHYLAGQVKAEDSLTSITEYLSVQEILLHELDESFLD